MFQSYSTHAKALEKYEKFKHMEFLVIDELNEIKERFIDDFQDFLDSRIRYDKKTIITTNLNFSEIEEKFKDKILNRLEIQAATIVLEGKKYERSA